PGHDETGVFENPVLVLLREALELVKFRHILVGDVFPSPESIDVPVFRENGGRGSEEPHGQRQSRKERGRAVLTDVGSHKKWMAGGLRFGIRTEILISYHI